MSFVDKKAWIQSQGVFVPPFSILDFVDSFFMVIYLARSKFLPEFCILSTQGYNKTVIGTIITS